MSYTTIGISNKRSSYIIVLRDILAPTLIESLSLFIAPEQQTTILAP